MNTTPKDAAFVSQIEREIANECDIPPFGWRCTRGKGHEGPCAAVEAPEDVSGVTRAMQRLRDEAPIAATQAQAGEEYQFDPYIREPAAAAPDHTEDARGMVADGWIACADRLPDLDVPVFGITAGMGLSVYMRDSGGGDGWLWDRQTWVHDLASLQGFECDDDYEVTHWRPMFALPEETKK